MSYEAPRRAALSFALATMLLGVCSNRSTAGEEATKPPLAGPIIPKPEPLAPAPFTLQDRYLDAARRGDAEMLRMCLDKGVDARAKDDFGRSALLLAALNAKSLDTVKLLEARGLPIDEPDNSGHSPLAYAAGNGLAEMVSYLLEKGAVVDRKDFQGQTPLYHAVLAGSKETALRLLAAKANVNTRDQFGDTPLMGACAKGFDDLAKMLVEKGADPALQDQEGRTAGARALEGAAYCRSLKSS